MIYRNITEVSTMWMQDDRNKRTKGTHKTNFNVKKGTDLEKGDLIYINKNKQDQECYWLINEILDKRQSSLSQYNYIETMCSYVVGNQS